MALEDPGSRDQEGINYYDRYDNVETSIGASDLTSVSVVPRQHGDVGASMPSVQKGLDTGLEDYIRDTVYNLSRLALRSMPKTRFQELVTEAMQ